MLVKIHPDGTKEMLYRDDCPLIPRKRIISAERVSDVRFDSASRLWLVCHPETKKPLFPQGFERREDAIKAEIEYLENKGLEI
jgi:hypothetical protein